MIISCEKCNTKYRLDSSRVSYAPVKVQCSKCNHIFIVPVHGRETQSPEPGPVHGAPAEKEERQEFEGAGQDMAGADTGAGPEQGPLATEDIAAKSDRVLEDEGELDKREEPAPSPSSQGEEEVEGETPDEGAYEVEEPSSTEQPEEEDEEGRVIFNPDAGEAAPSAPPQNEEDVASDVETSGEEGEPSGHAPEEDTGLGAEEGSAEEEVGEVEEEALGDEGAEGAEEVNEAEQGEGGPQDEETPERDFELESTPSETSREEHDGRVDTVSGAFSQIFSMDDESPGENKAEAPNRPEQDEELNAVDGADEEGTGAETIEEEPGAEEKRDKGSEEESPSYLDTNIEKEAPSEDSTAGFDLDFEKAGGTGESETTEEAPEEDEDVFDLSFTPDVKIPGEEDLEKDEGEWATLPDGPWTEDKTGEEGTRSTAATDNEIPRSPEPYAGAIQKEPFQQAPEADSKAAGLPHEGPQGQEPSEPRNTFVIPDVPVEEEVQKKSGPGRVIALLVVILIIAGGIIYLKSRPDSALMAGPEGTKTLSIESTKGYYVLNKGGTRIFVIETMLKNISDGPVRISGIRGLVMDSSGQEMAHKMVSPGRIVTNDDLRNLPLETLLRSFDDTSEGTIPRGAVIPTMVLFTGLPGTVAEYGVDVLR